MKLTLLTAALTVATLFPINAHSGSANAHDAQFNRELDERELAYRLAPIKSKADIQSYLARTAGGKTPLSALSHGAKRRFLQSLVFTDRGLASFDYRDLRVELTATQIHEILSLFGVQRSINAIPGLRVVSPGDVAIAEYGGDWETDYSDYWCESKASCRRSTGAICIGDNC